MKLLRAGRSKAAEQDGQVGQVDDTVSVEVPRAVRRIVAATKVAEQRGEIRQIDDAVAIQIRRAVTDIQRSDVAGDATAGVGDNAPDVPRSGAIADADVPRAAL